MGEEALTIKENVEIPGWELWVTASRSGGPGGQHSNKVSTQVTLHWSVKESSVFGDEQKEQLKRRLQSYLTEEGVLQVTASDTRSQHRNRKIARERLARMIQKALQRKKRRKATRPSEAARRRRLEEKRKRGKRKELRKHPTPRNW